MVVEDIQGSRGLAHSDEFLCSLRPLSVLIFLSLSRQKIRTHLENILGLDMRRRRHVGPLWQPLRQPLELLILTGIK